MRKFSDEEIVDLHDCLKIINVVNKLPPSEETDYYINILREVVDRLNLDEQLSIYLYMAHDTILNLISEKDIVKDIKKSDIIEVD